MYRIDEFMRYYNSLEGTDMEIIPGVWVHARPFPFYSGLFTKDFWRERKQRKKDAKAVLKGEAVAVTWENIK